MPSFKDNKGRIWSIELDAPTVQKVRRDTCGISGCRHRPLTNSQCEGVDLWDMSGKSFQKMDFDTVLMVDVLWLICEEQAIAKDISEADFAQGLRGDVLPEATATMLKASVESLDPIKRQFLERAAATRRRHEELALSRTIDRIESPETEAMLMENLDNRIDETLKQRLTQLRTATATPDS